MVVSLGVALATAIVGIVSTGIWASYAREPARGSPDDNGVSLVAILFYVISLAAAAATGVVTVLVLAVRRHRRSKPSASR